MRTLNAKRALPIFAVLFISGCSTPPRVVYVDRTPPPERTQTPKPSTKPPGFDLALNIENYTIVNHKILSLPQNLGKMRFAGKWRYVNGNLLYKFKSESHPNYYWIAEIPENANAKNMEVRATPRLEPGTDLIAVAPPKTFRVLISIRGGRIENQALVDPQPGWGIFSLANWQKPIATLKNPEYPKCEWKGRWPTADGQATATMLLETDDCYDK
jgi:hypothetical protein